MLGHTWNVSESSQHHGDWGSEDAEPNVLKS